MKTLSDGGITIPLRFIFLTWVAFAVQELLFIDLGFLGIYPRTLTGFIGIFTGPLIHGNLIHIISNTIPLLVLGGTLFIFYEKVAARVFYQNYLLTGLAVWLFARQSYHIGSSGLLYALASFLIFYGIFRKDLKSLLISIIIIFLYGGLIYGVMPWQPGVSWESHLLGAVTGFFVAFYHGWYKYKA